MEAEKDLKDYYAIIQKLIKNSVAKNSLSLRILLAACLLIAAFFCFFYPELSSIILPSANLSSTDVYAANYKPVFPSDNNLPEYELSALVGNPTNEEKETPQANETDNTPEQPENCFSELTDKDILIPKTKYAFEHNIDFPSLLKENSDLVAWLISEGTVIDYPIVMGKDNEQYLFRDFNGGYSVEGTLFMDVRNKLGTYDRHIIIHGHHMKAGTMFASLVNYKSQDYYDNHSTMLLLTPEANYLIELFSSYVASVDDETFTYTFENDNEFSAFIEAIKAKSDFNSDIVPTIHDRIISLSTCDYEFDNARYVVHGRLVKISE